MIFNVVLPAQSAGGATSVTMAGIYYPLPQTTDTLQQIWFTPTANITGANTNYATVNVRQTRAGAVLNTLATYAFTSGKNATAEVPLALSFTTQPVMQTGDVIDVQLVQSGTGLAIPAGCMVTVVVA